MFDWSLSVTQLVCIWAFAGLACMLPLFVKAPWHKFVIVPVLFLAIYISFNVNEKFVGRPYYAVPTEKFIYQGHRFEIVEKQKVITLWTIIDKDDRLYRLPWTKEKQEALNKARKLSRKGIPQIGHFTKKKKQPKAEDKSPGPQRDTSNDMSLKFYTFPHQERFPKDKKR